MSVSIDFDLDLDFVRIWAIPGLDDAAPLGQKTDDGDGPCPPCLPK